MRQVLKSFTKIYTVTSGTSEVIELRDTSGTLLDCNYASIESNTSIVTTGYIHIEPSSVYANEVDLSATSGTVSFSGAGGATIQTGGGPIEFSVADSDRFNALKVTAYQSTAPLIINYGVIKHQNPLRDNDRPPGE